MEQIYFLVCTSKICTYTDTVVFSVFNSWFLVFNKIKAINKLFILVDSALKIIAKPFRIDDVVFSTSSPKLANEPGWTARLFLIKN